MLKKLILAGACAGMLALQSAQAESVFMPAPDGNNPEMPSLLFTAATNFGIGFIANFLSNNTRIEKIIGNTAGIGLSVFTINKTDSLKDAAAQMLCNYGTYNHSEDFITKSFILKASKTKNEIARAAFAIAGYSTGALAGTASRALWNTTYYWAKGTYNLLTGNADTKKNN